MFFANLVSRETRWLPPRLWLAGWVSRAPLLADGYELDVSSDACRGLGMSFPAVAGRQRANEQSVLPVLRGRECVEGGAPFYYDFHFHGSPQYMNDGFDTEYTHPSCCVLSPEECPKGMVLPARPSRESATSPLPPQSSLSSEPSLSKSDMSIEGNSDLDADDTDENEDEDEDEVDDEDEDEEDYVFAPLARPTSSPSVQTMQSSSVPPPAPPSTQTTLSAAVSSFSPPSVQTMPGRSRPKRSRRAAWRQRCIMIM